jgi:hypothetical protein
MSDDRHDPRVRELTYRLMEMAPDAPPFPEEAIAMNVPATKQRPPLLVWAAAAAVVVLLIGLPLILFRGGDEPADSATTIAASDSTATTTLADESTTAPETTSPPVTTTPPEILLPVDTSGDCRQDWEDLGDWDPSAWYVFLGCDRPGMEEILVPRPRALVSGEIEDVGSAMIEQLTGPTDEELEAGYFAFTVEEGDPGQYVGYRVTGSDVQFEFVDFRSDPGMSNASASTASMHLLAELSAVSFQFPVVDSVTFTFDGDCDLFWNWLQRDCSTVLRADWEDSEMGARIAAWQALSSGTPPTTTLPAGDSTTTLPGEAFDIGPAAGDVVAVVGVHFGDVLNVREGPGTQYEIVATLAPQADDVVATGRHRLLESSIWNEVTVEGEKGWVNSRFLGYLGGVDDLTAVVVDALGGIPEAETMVEMGDIVAESFRSDEGGFRYKISGAPSVGDLGEITVDVLGLADDALLGYRLHIFGQPTAGGEGFSLKSVEGTALCGRGVTEDGLCV